MSVTGVSSSYPTYFSQSPLPKCKLAEFFQTTEIGSDFSRKFEGNEKPHAAYTAGKIIRYFKQLLPSFYRPFYLSHHINILRSIMLFAFLLRLLEVALCYALPALATLQAMRDQQSHKLWLLYWPAFSLITHFAFPILDVLPAQLQNFLRVIILGGALLMLLVQGRDGLSQIQGKVNGIFLKVAEETRSRTAQLLLLAGLQTK